VALTSLTVEALSGFDLTRKKDAERAKNMFALGLLSWLYHRPTRGDRELPQPRSSRASRRSSANIAALHAGYNYGDTTEDFVVRYEVAPAPMPAAPTATSAATWRCRTG
jgi:2-oxoglutarate ferredoxin oxidoreductase subunit alpha